jgi:hypothetical protein
VLFTLVFSDSSLCVLSISGSGRSFSIPLNEKLLIHFDLDASEKLLVYWAIAVIFVVLLFSPYFCVY